MEHARLYDRDFYAWTVEQSDHLIRENWFALDWANLAEEIRSMGLQEYHAVESHVQNTLTHLLLYQYQPATRRHGTDQARESTLMHLREAIRRLIQDSPSLAQTLPRELQKCYDRARGHAADFALLEMSTFPETCPWSLYQIMDDSFLPST